MTDKPWKLVLLLTGIFVAGAIVGGVASLAVAKKMVRERLAPEMWGPAHLKMLERRLELTPRQMERLRPLVRRDVEDLNRLRQQGFQETRRIIERMERDISAVLTPEQKAKFEEFNAERRERARRMLEQRRGRGDRRGPPSFEHGPPPDGRDAPPPPPEGKGPGDAASD
jgi:hypothetical protein